MFNRPSLFQKVIRGVAYLKKDGKKNLWPQHSTVLVSFYPPVPKLISPVTRAIEEWQKHINLDIKYCQHGHVKISFYNCYSYATIGNVCLSQKQPALVNIYPDTEENMYIDALHEFGHVLGLAHEHQHPRTPIRYNRKELIRWTQKLNIPFMDIKDNFYPLKETKRDKFLLTSFDPQSIMIYDLPKHIIAEPFKQTKNVGLSDGDKHIISLIYPK